MPLRILFLSHYFHPNIGGIETISEVLAKAFVDAGHEVRLVTWTKENSTQSFPFEIIRNPTKKTLLKEHAWAELVFESNPCLKLSWPAFFYRKPTVIVLHTWLPDMNQHFSLIGKMKQLWLHRAKKVIAVSEAIRKRCFPAATVIANSFNADTFKLHPGIERNRDFIFVGRLVSDKGAMMAIKALHQLTSGKNGTEPLKNYTLTIVGDGPEKTNLQREAKKLNLEKNIRFEGSLTGIRLAECLNQHTYQLVPSLWEEPFGIVALEGLACGCIPIVSDGGGLPDAVGSAGLTFHKGNINDFVQVIQNILKDNTLRQQLKNHAPKHIKAHYPATIANKYLNIIYETLKVPIHL